uniref:Uncharacterized protein n=1 Tax=uncultured marine virus TaxID=186617 RepID=A0A0F7L543_9VIRU|nr:hypothetical protein [uncultured marine virus]
MTARSLKRGGVRTANRSASGDSGTATVRACLITSTATVRGGRVSGFGCGRPTEGIS